MSTNKDFKVKNGLTVAGATSSTSFTAADSSGYNWSNSTGLNGNGSGGYINTYIQGTVRSALSATGLSITGTLATSGKYLASGAVEFQSNSCFGTSGTNWIGTISGDTNISTQAGKGFVFVTGGTQTATIDSAGNLGLGITPNAWYANAKAIDLQGGSIWSSATGNMVMSQNMYLDTAATYRWKTANPATYFNIGNGISTWNISSGTPIAGGAIGAFTQAMTLDASGSLLFGTGTYATARASLSSPSGDGELRVSGDSINYGIFKYSSGTGLYLGTTTSKPVNFQINNVVQAVLDTSGNLGIGITPSPWVAYHKGLDFGYASTGYTAGFGGLSARGDFVMLSSNAYINTSGVYVYKNDGAFTATTYTQSAGSHAWNSYAANSSGTAGTTLGAVTGQTILTATGNMGLGTSPSGWFSVYRALEIGTYGAAITGQTNAEALTLWSNAYPNSANVDTYKVSGVSATKLRMEAGQFKFSTAASGTAGNPVTFAQAMTLNTAGNLVFNGTTSSSISTSGGVSAKVFSAQGPLLAHQTSMGIFQHDGANATGIRAYGTAGNGYINFNIGGGGGTADYTAMTLDATGNLLVGATSLAVSPQGVAIYPAGAINIGHASTASGVSYSAYYYNGNNIGTITQNGTNGVLYNTTSDYRLKSDVRSIKSSGIFIDGLRPSEWFWSDGTLGRGFIAHEVQQVSPSSVAGVKDAVDAEGKPIYQSMQAGSPEIVAMLVAEIQDLRKRLAVLEAK